MAKRIVVIGGGFAGTRVLENLEKEIPSQAAKLVLINKNNFSLYTPFLPEAAAGTLEPRHVVTPLREVLKRTQIRVDQVQSHSKKEKALILKSGETVNYDYLVVALGSISKTLNISGLKENAFGFKSLVDAVFLRNQLIENLEIANSVRDEKEATQLLTFVFVGGGYAGLEALAELQDFARQAILNYPLARLRGMRWVLVESSERVLKEIDPSLATYSTRELESRGIEVLTNTTLTKLTKNQAVLSTGEKIPSKTVVWTAGVEPNPVLKDLDLNLDQDGKVIVNQNLEMNDSVFALGDCALVPEKNGFAPPTAQHALRQADVVSSNILFNLGLKEKKKKYKYNSKNAFVNLGRYQAVGRIGKLRFSGFLAWFLARTYHLSQIPGRSRKLRLILDWTISLPFKRDLSELGGNDQPGLKD
jgi:NADH dehydrogenase